MKQYKTILADPPWEFGNKNTGGSMISGSANKYPTLSVDSICNLTVNLEEKEYMISEIADENAVLFLWVPTSLKEYGFEVMKTWQFRYKTTIYWHKPYKKEEKKGKLGMGFWFRNQIEECFFGTRGKVTPFKSNETNIIEEFATKHSRKPSGFFKKINPILDKFDLNPKIELFAREKQTGWDGWGLEYPEYTP
jgi:N6-adenosine-specific RNA methylase IME4